ncbi:MAG: hypothetical protein M2R45_04026 [Verrucomicrobia subdivision 3 bacterium]|nr:hypothetical protein [Limisphaerales bacterium]MCS1416990.1 hypothetical protein [Limisphaerales bacterium]
MRRSGRNSARVGLQWKGFTEPELIGGLLSIELFDLEMNEELITDTWLSILPGDKFYTDEDWRDEDFLAAKAWY